MSSEHVTGFEFGNRQKTFKAYMVGYFGSLLLTIAAFAFVHYKAFPDTMLYIAISLLAITQLVVQSVCFLRMNATPAGRWNLLPFLFSLMVIAFVIGGSLWIMYNCNYNMGHTLTGLKEVIS